MDVLSLFVVVLHQHTTGISLRVVCSLPITYILSLSLATTPDIFSHSVRRRVRMCIAEITDGIVEHCRKRIPDAPRTLPERDPRRSPLHSTLDTRHSTLDTRHNAEKRYATRLLQLVGALRSLPFLARGAPTTNEQRCAKTNSPTSQL